MFSLLKYSFSVRLLEVEWFEVKWLVTIIYETETTACWYYILNVWLVALELKVEVANFEIFSWCMPYLNVW
jgi:hypothetical protein